MHRIDAETPPPADHHLDVTGYSPAEQQAAVETLWAATAHNVGLRMDPTKVVHKESTPGR